MHKITITTSPEFRPLRTIAVVSAQIFVIGVGVMTDSSAMQWMGFLVLMLMAVALASSHAKKNSDLTIDEARTRLDEIERNGE